MWPTVVLAATGLGLIALGGCFLIGVMLAYMPAMAQVNPTPTVWSSGVYAFVTVLYVLATLCFLGAIAVLYLAIRTALRAGV